MKVHKHKQKSTQTHLVVLVYGYYCTYLHESTQHDMTNCQVQLELYHTTRLDERCIMTMSEQAIIG